ncbi:YggS family pyridoxal phosphate-dependent enzyme [Basilea psittacipulmonis]|uniref:Pyridoxal phosphate homeostasis protein n=1 Tax=Basilea psittacipulmonis DSM 24701 TaxID=1072685 RepID=A0A077DFI6_9BURK|nr:YggS family pyridoxal phosphate-dependent enzyme [Basilea psittacipulmonis]AIL32926.1 alanine racemase [Basilea psittacipulmonis DSM 24701]
MENNIPANIANILHRIETAAIHAQRQANEIRLLMATKTVSPDRIKIALATGQTLIAENKVQEVKEKFEALQAIPHESHFIGHLQTNKINELLRYDIQCIHSMDRLDLAKKLQTRLEAQNKTMSVLIQVNTSGEESKYGCSPQDTLSLIKEIHQMPSLQIKGLMTIGANTQDEHTVRQCFQLLKSLQNQAQEMLGTALPELSMGMSGDLELAIEEGATIIRVGSAIFGQRSYTNV